MGLKWHGAERTKDCQAASMAKLARAVRLLKNHARAQCNTAAALLVIAAAEGIKFTKKQAERERSWNPAGPGGYPHKRTGLGRMSIDEELIPDRLAARWGD